MRALVTGSSGVLGACLVAPMLERGTPLRLLVLVPRPDGGPPPGSGVEFVQADLRDRQAVACACQDIEVVYHLAAGQRMKPQFAGMSERDIFDMNVRAVEHVLAGALAAGVRKLVHVSSSGVYGIPRAVPVSEDHPQRPLGAYGRSKIAAEERCREALGPGLGVTILRPMSLFRPGMTGLFVLDIRRAREVLGSEPGWSNVGMTNAAYDWYCRYWEIHQPRPGPVLRLLNALS